MFYRLNDDGNAVIFNDDGTPTTRIDADVYDMTTYLSARYEHPKGVVLTVKGAKEAGIGRNKDD